MNLETSISVTITASCQFPFH